MYKPQATTTNNDQSEKKYLQQATKTANATVPATSDTTATTRKHSRSARLKETPASSTPEAHDTRETNASSPPEAPRHREDPSMGERRGLGGGQSPNDSDHLEQLRWRLVVQRPRAPGMVATVGNEGLEGHEGHEEAEHVHEEHAEEGPEEEEQHEGHEEAEHVHEEHEEEGQEEDFEAEEHEEAKQEGLGAMRELTKGGGTEGPGFYKL